VNNYKPKGQGAFWYICPIAGFLRGLNRKGEEGAKEREEDLTAKARRARRSARRLGESLLLCFFA
jgi:hypothetical protein